MTELGDHVGREAGALGGPHQRIGRVRLVEAVGLPLVGGEERHQPAHVLVGVDLVDLGAPSGVGCISSAYLRSIMKTGMGHPCERVLRRDRLLPRVGPVDRRHNGPARTDARHRVPGMDSLPLVFSSGWASGVNAYLVVLVLGIADRINPTTEIPDALQRVGRPGCRLRPLRHGVRGRQDPLHRLDVGRDLHGDPADRRRRDRPADGRGRRHAGPGGARRSSAAARRCCPTWSSPGAGSPSTPPPSRSPTSRRA